MIQTRAFVLVEEPIAEIDRRYVLFTSEFGKIEARAKAVRKVTAKLAGHLEPVNFSWVGLLKGKGSQNGNDSWQVAQALSEETFPFLRRSPDTFRIVLSGARILDELVLDSVPEKDLFFLWHEFLFGLHRVRERNEATDPEFYLSQFIIRLVQGLGFLAHPSECTHCGDVLSGKGAYFFRNQFLCGRCAGTREGAWLSPRALGVLEVIIKPVWLRESSESEAINQFAQILLRETKTLTR